MKIELTNVQRDVLVNVINKFQEDIQNDLVDTEMLRDTFKLCEADLYNELDLILAKL